MLLRTNSLKVAPDIDVDRVLIWAHAKAVADEANELVDAGIAQFHADQPIRAPAARQHGSPRLALLPWHTAARHRSGDLRPPSVDSKCLRYLDRAPLPGRSEITRPVADVHLAESC